jgi:hypothetical protein
MAKPLTLAAELRTLSEPRAIQNVGGARKFVRPKNAKKTTEPAPAKESLASSMGTIDMVTLLGQTFRIMPDPDEVLRKAGLNRAALRKLTYDDDIAQAIDTRRDAAVNTPWRLEGGTDEINKFIVDQISQREDIIFPSLWNARLFGYSVTQVVFADLGPRVGISWVGEMPFEYYVPQRDGTVMYRPAGGGDLQPVMAEKYLVPVIYPTYLNPYGDALLSRLYWLWFFRTHGWQYWVQWLEQFGAPFLHGKTANVTDPMTGTKSVDALAAMLDKTRRGSSVATDINTEIELLEQKSQGSQFKDFDNAVTRQIAKVILGQTLTSSEGTHGGNRALGQIHEEVRQDKRRADIKLLCRMGQQLVNVLHGLNGFAGDPPVFMMEDEKGLQKDRATRDADLVDKGVVVFTRDYLKDSYDLDDEDFFAPGEEEFTKAKSALAPADPNADPNAPKPKKPGAPPPAKKQSVHPALAALFSTGPTRFTPEQQVIEEGVAWLTQELPGHVVDPDTVLQCIRDASDINDLAFRLSVALQDAPLHVFTAIFEKALGAAEVIGFVHAKDHAGDDTPSLPTKGTPQP